MGSASGISKGLSDSIIKSCQEKLVATKATILNRLRDNSRHLLALEKGIGDEVDQTVAQMEENQFVAQQERLRGQLVEIEFALSRIEQGSYGICEETEEIIEADRLLAIPWTRLSVEGAEIREATSRKYARL